MRGAANSWAGRRCTGHGVRGVTLFASIAAATTAAMTVRRLAHRFVCPIAMISRAVLYRSSASAYAAVRPRELLLTLSLLVVPRYSKAYDADFAAANGPVGLLFVWTSAPAVRTRRPAYFGQPRGAATLTSPAPGVQVPDLQHLLASDGPFHRRRA